MGLLGRVKQCEEERNGNKNLQEKKEKKVKAYHFGHTQGNSSGQRGEA